MWSLEIWRLVAVKFRFAVQSCGSTCCQLCRPMCCVIRRPTCSSTCSLICFAVLLHFYPARLLSVRLLILAVRCPLAVLVPRLLHLFVLFSRALWPSVFDDLRLPFVLVVLGLPVAVARFAVRFGGPVCLSMLPLVLAVQFACDCSAWSFVVRFGCAFGRSFRLCVFGYALQAVPPCCSLHCALSCSPYCPLPLALPLLLPLIPTSCRTARFVAHLAAHLGARFAAHCAARTAFHLTAHHTAHHTA